MDILIVIKMQRTQHPWMSEWCENLREYWYNLASNKIQNSLILAYFSRDALQLHILTSDSFVAYILAGTRSIRPFPPRQIESGSQKNWQAVANVYNTKHFPWRLLFLVNFVFKLHVSNFRNSQQSGLRNESGSI